MRIVWINLYRQGHYHRVGKPGTLPFHAGDTYESREAARADVDLEAPYIATVPLVLVPEHMNGFAWGQLQGAPYPATSEPVPLRETRNQFNKEPQQ